MAFDSGGLVVSIGLSVLRILTAVDCQSRTMFKSLSCTASLMRQVFYMPNHLLATKTIVNIQRTAHQWHEFMIQVRGAGCLSGRDDARRKSASWKPQR